MPYFEVSYVPVIIESRVPPGGSELKVAVGSPADDVTLSIESVRLQKSISYNTQVDFSKNKDSLKQLKLRDPH